MNLQEVKLSFTNTPENFELVPDCLAAIFDRAGIAFDDSRQLLVLIDKLISERSTTYDLNHHELAEILVSLESGQLTLSISLRGRVFSSGKKEMLTEIFREVCDTCLISSESGAEVIVISKVLNK